MPTKGFYILRWTIYMENILPRARCELLEMKMQHKEITVTLGLLLQPSAAASPRALLQGPHPTLTPGCHCATPVPSTRARWELVQYRMSHIWVHC